MSKPKQKRLNSDKIDTYLDTSDIFPHIFPSRLKNKLLSTVDIQEYNEEYYSLLQQYLESKNPDFLIQALKINDSVLWYGRTKYDDFANDLILKNDHEWESVKEIEDCIVIWETLIDWVNNSHFLFERGDLYERGKLLKKAKAYLNKIAPTLLLQRIEYEVYNALDGIVHYKSHIQGRSDYIGYTSPEEFMSEYTKIREIFNSVRTKTKRNLEEKIEDIKKAIQKLNDNVSEDDLKYFNLTSLHKKNKLHINSIVLHYMRNRHGNICKKCNDISYTKIEELYRDAKKGKNLHPFSK